MATFDLILPVEYSCIVLAGVLLCFECWAIGFLVVSKARFRYFNKEFMEQF